MANNFYNEILTEHNVRPEFKYDLPDVTKLVCCLCMIIGRLEIFTFLAMLQPGFWKRNSNW